MFTKGMVFGSLAATVAINVTVALAGTDGNFLNSNKNSLVPVNVHAVYNHITGPQPEVLPFSSRKAVHQINGRTSAGNDGVPVYSAVEQGQTLWFISQKFNISVSDLESWNHLTNSSVLHIGQQLIVGWGSTASTPTKSSRDGTVDANVAAASQGLAVVGFAEQFLGAPYSWGGTTPSGFDCSGFVMYAYQHVGINLPHTSYGQFQLGVTVSKDSLAPGDLVFFSTDGSGASHVGIYVGNAKFINAAGDSIRYSSLSDGYWASNYVGARRVIQV